jgi:two-component system, NtrC family, response regulator AtoC
VGTKAVATELRANQTLQTPPAEVIFGTSEMMQHLRHKVLKVSGTTVPVLIEGDSGTGKEVLARYIHANSPIRHGPFVKVSCAAIPNTLTESELFGYEKGAFTGANATKPGRIELANGGTLYLDEIAELDPTRQATLLQVLQDGRFSRIGDQEDKVVDARVICATNRRLEKEIATGGFRQDLFYRINVFHLHMPPLRERSHDVPMIADYLLVDSIRRFGRPQAPLTNEIHAWMRNYSWPGNIRELESWIVRYVLLGVPEMHAIQSDSRRLINMAIHSQADGSIPLKSITKKAILEAERAVILRTLETHHWNRRRTAQALKVSYRALIYKIRQAGLPARRPAKKAESPSTAAAMPADAAVAPSTD